MNEHLPRSSSDSVLLSLVDVGDVDAQDASVHVLTVELADDHLGLLGGGHGDEPEPAAAAGFAVGDEPGVLHRAKLAAEILQVEVVHAPGEVAEVDLTRVELVRAVTLGAGGAVAALAARDVRACRVASATSPRSPNAMSRFVTVSRLSAVPCSQSTSASEQPYTDFETMPVTTVDTTKSRRNWKPKKAVGGVPFFSHFRK